MIFRPSKFQNAQPLRLRPTEVEGETSRVEFSALASFLIQKGLPGAEDTAYGEDKSIWQ